MFKKGDKLKLNNEYYKECFWEKNGPIKNWVMEFIEYKNDTTEFSGKWIVSDGNNSRTSNGYISKWFEKIKKDNLNEIDYLESIKSNEDNYYV